MTADAEGPAPNPGPAAEDYPDTVAGTSHGAGAAETQIIANSPHQIDTPSAWSEVNDDPAPESWGSVWGRAAVVVALAAAVTAIVAIVGLIVVLQNDNHQQRGAATNTATMPPAALPPIASEPAAAPTKTVTVTPAAPATVTVEAAPPPAPPPVALPPDTNVFTICPDGHEGVVGGHTSCAFAENVRRTFYATGEANHFTAFSPVTGDAYEITCAGRYPAYFTDGSTMISTRCYGGENAEVVIW